MPRFGPPKDSDRSGLTQGERAFRNYLYDKLIDDLGILQKNGWLQTASFDTVVQQLHFEKHDPVGAREGGLPASSSANLPAPPPGRYESEFTEKSLGPIKFKSYKRPEDDGSAVSAVLPASRQPTMFRQQEDQGTIRRAPTMPALPAPAQHPGRQQVIAIADFDTREPGDLRFAAGDVIDVVEDVDANWYKGRLRGQEGIFPKTYVEVRPIGGGPPLPRRI
ncbi:Neutrophil cytosol factor 2 [Rhizophlyctis rosea]|nr:Neutrophil cytosol factor 2 [Rhizophlyctis rosea]